MIRFLLATASAMPCRPHQESGRAVALLPFAGTYLLIGGKSVSEGIATAIPPMAKFGSLHYQREVQGDLTPT